MTEEQLQPFLDTFDENDTDKKGSINLDQFKNLFPEIMGKNATDESAEMYFRGIDANNNGRITRQEFSNFVKSAINKDQDFMIELAFRSFDKDQSQNLNCSEVKAIAKYAGREMTDDEVEAAMESFTGSKNGSLTYAQVYKMITGKDLEGQAVGNNKHHQEQSDKPVKPLSDKSNVNVPTRSSPTSAPPPSSSPSAPETPEETKKKSSCCLLI